MRTLSASSSAVAAPMPLLAPVITTVRWSDEALCECAVRAADTLDRSIRPRCVCVARHFDHTVAARETNARDRLPVPVSDADPTLQHSCWSANTPGWRFWQTSMTLQPMRSSMLAADTC